MLLDSAATCLHPDPESISVSEITQLIDHLPSSSSSSAASTDVTHNVLFVRAGRLVSSFSAATVAVLFQLPQLCARADIRVVFSAFVPFAVFRHAHVNPISHSPCTVYSTANTCRYRHVIVRGAATDDCGDTPRPANSDERKRQIAEPVRRLCESGG